LYCIFTFIFFVYRLNDFIREGKSKELGAENNCRHPSWELSPDGKQVPIPGDIEDLDFGDVVEYLTYDKDCSLDVPNSWDMLADYYTTINLGKSILFNVSDLCNVISSMK